MDGVGIIIVTYNSAAVIGACLDAVLPSHAQIVVVDNASSDATVAEAVRRGVRVVTNSSNRGFAAAVNQGFSVLSADYVLLLNPDTVLQTSLEPLLAACSLPDAAGASGRLVHPDGTPQIGFMVRELPTPAALALEALLLNRIWPGNPINSQYRGLRLDYSRLQVVKQPAGAFVMIRRAVWDALGGFDEKFWPLWFEDVDFCRRAINLGYRWYYVPQVVAKHTGAHSIQELGVEMRRVYWYRSLLRYSVKHFSPAKVRVVCLAVITGSLLRMPAESAMHLSLRPMTACGKVVWLAGRLLFGQYKSLG